jgi:hypothetical protein
MTPAMDPCPYAAPKARGAHDLCLVIPDNDGTPILAICSRCGDAVRHAVDLPAPLDNLPADAIAKLAKRG